MLRRRSVGIVDYGAGNHRSVQSAVHRLGYADRLSCDRDELASCDLLLLPGVGTYYEAMVGLQRYQLVSFIREWVKMSRPLVGICLGMQILSETGKEGGQSEGLGIISGQTVMMEKGFWHIGWNALQVDQADSLFRPYESQDFYFNHAWYFETSAPVVIAHSQYRQALPAIVRHDATIGLQFHPEKSQAAGLDLLHDVLDELTHA